MRAVDVHGFGGGFTLGMVQSGFELQAKMSRYVGFGVLNTLGNRHLLGDGWESVAAHPDEWDPVEAEVVFGNPPCSGFSPLTSAKGFRGMDSSINDYMWELVHYAARVKPVVVAWESVQQTFRQGLPLMRRLRDTLEEESGIKYHLTHVLHNNASLGGVAIRRRYFWVASQVPFGVDHYPLTRVPTLNDALRDLLPLGLTMAEQPYKGVSNGVVLNSSWWARQELHDGTGRVDGHDIVRTPGTRRSLELFEPPYNMDWHQGETLTAVLKRCYEKYGRLPEGWYYPITTGRYAGVHATKADSFIAQGFPSKQSDMGRWYGDKMARVVVGAAANGLIHPTLPRTFTQREIARIQGFPDAWKIWPVRDAPDLGPGWGKGVPVQAGRWLGKWIMHTLNRNPGPLRGVPVPEASKLLRKLYPETVERETVVDVTYDYKPYALAIGDKG